MTITRATVGDAAEILALQKLAYVSEAQIYDDYDIPPLAQTLEEITAEFERSVVLKLVSDDRIIGSVRARETGGIVEIGRLIVHPDNQGQGWGRRLLAAMEAEFPRAACFELFTGDRSERNLHLYRSSGYVDVRHDQMNGGPTLVYLRKQGADQTGQVP